MQATIDSVALRPFTRALTCLSRYGDELSIYATPQTLVLSATNSTLSAYCRFKYDKLFFSRYSISERNAGPLADDMEETLTVTGQLLTKSLLSVLRARTIEKTVERCELSIVDASAYARGEPGENQDSLESKLIVRLHCKHGVVKTHRLVLSTPTSLMAPAIPDVPNESRLIIGPKAIKDMIEHFPIPKGPKSDPQLIWNFCDADVRVRSLDIPNDVKGRELSTELSISAEEFDVYDVSSPPITIAFHLREFNATIAYAESMTLPLDLHFTDANNPLYVNIEGNSSETLFIISTSQVRGADTGQSSSQGRQTTPANSNKRRDRDESLPPGRTKKPMKVVQRAVLADVARAENNSRSQSRALHSVPPPCSRGTPPPLPPDPRHSSAAASAPTIRHQPLFLPTSSQLSAKEEEEIQGIRNMNVDELNEMLIGDGEEVGLDLSQRSGDMAGNDDEYTGNLIDSFGDQGGADGPDSFELVDEIDLAPTQSQSSSNQSKAFRPLFED